MLMKTAAQTLAEQLCAVFAQFGWGQVGRHFAAAGEFGNFEMQPPVIKFAQLACRAQVHAIGASTSAWASISRARGSPRSWTR